MPQHWKKGLCSGGEWVWGDPGGREKISCLTFFCCHKFHKIYFWRGTEIKCSQLTKNQVFFTQNLGWVSEIRIEGSKKHQMPDPDLQQWEKRLCSGGERVWGDPKYSSRIRILIFLPIPDLGFRGQKVPDPGSGSATLKKKIVSRRRMSVRVSWWRWVGPTWTKSWTSS